mmetsp:Transcript_22888/g.53569  ORF Transcript_22888/g.53569 Transcript_22888/m.53569 type:complete len:240 (+) Transcript_22888:237-956(+)
MLDLLSKIRRTDKSSSAIQRQLIVCPAPQFGCCNTSSSAPSSPPCARIRTAKFKECSLILNDHCNREPFSTKWEAMCSPREDTLTSSAARILTSAHCSPSRVVLKVSFAEPFQAFGPSASCEDCSAAAAFSPPFPARRFATFAETDFTMGSASPFVLFFTEPAMSSVFAFNCCTRSDSEIALDLSLRKLKPDRKALPRLLLEAVVTLPTCDGRSSSGLAPGAASSPASSMTVLSAAASV